MKAAGSGGYDELHDEKTLMDLTTFVLSPSPHSHFLRATHYHTRCRSTKNCIVHFFHSDFRRCKIMDGHLETLAPMHAESRFIRIDVDKAPFLVERLAVRVLPCVLSFVDGKSVGRIEGFERMGNTDGFRTVRLEEVLVEFGVLERIRMTDEAGGGGGKIADVDDDSGDDWD
jgi:hypothetical protein